MKQGTLEQRERLPTPAQIAAGEAAFDEWLYDNAADMRENGGHGDFAALVAALWAVWK
jgi:hypothetical protein